LPATAFALSESPGRPRPGVSVVFFEIPGPLPLVRGFRSFLFVMAGLVPTIHVLFLDPRIALRASGDFA
jgi:hypothetical protein